MVPPKKTFRLSVLIPTLPARISTYTVLLNNLREQIRSQKLESTVEIISLMDCKSMTIGDKRNKLIEMSSGDYVVFVDDDDNVPPYYLKTILDATKSNPDCVGIAGIIKFEERRDVKFIHSVKYLGDTKVDKVTVGRPPNHLNPIKRSIAISTKFPNQNFGEDKTWSDLLLPKLQTEKMVDWIMYVYFAYGSKSQSSPDSTLSHI